MNDLEALAHPDIYVVVKANDVVDEVIEVALDLLLLFPLRESPRRNGGLELLPLHIVRFNVAQDVGHVRIPLSK